MIIILGVLKGFGILIGIVVAYLLGVSFIPGIKSPKQPLKKSIEKIGVKPSALRKDVSFKVRRQSISAWLYLPKDLSAPVACIVMGHGLGGTKDAGLEAYAIRCQEAGYAVLAFDYRHFGESEGQPRQLAWIPYQLQDYKAAVEYARSLKEINPKRIALWGTSMSGGHVIVTAAKDKDIACVVAQCPGLDGFASGEMAFKRKGLGFTLRLMVHGQRDIVRGWLGLPPYKIPIVGKPGSIVLLTAPDAYEGYSKLMPDNFINEVCARIILRADKYRPVQYAKKVRCPVLLQICEKDSITPLSAAEETEKNLGKWAEVKRYPIGHFDIYTGENFKKSVGDQLDFFRKYL
jgi:fermentation-respiration switch protein FrsA (DUF1100 family)